MRTHRGKIKVVKRAKCKICKSKVQGKEMKILSDVFFRILDTEEKEQQQKLSNENTKGKTSVKMVEIL